MCHQTVSLVAGHLEANGIPTVVLGSALDIVEHCGVARFAFVDFPLGNPCGKPGDVAMQTSIVDSALALFDSAQAPRTTVSLPWRWQSDTWRERYMQVSPENRDELRRKGEQRRAERQALREAGRVRDE